MATRATIVEQAKLPTRHGVFRLVGFRFEDDDKEHVALVRGDVEREDVLVRIHSECLTGDAFGSFKCDCGDQLQRSLHQVAKAGQGVLLYLRQEGRGIGLVNKIRAYRLQETGLDTFEANAALGFAADGRDFDVAASMLHALGVRSVRCCRTTPKRPKPCVAKGSRFPRLCRCWATSRRRTPTIWRRSGSRAATDFHSRSPS